MQSNAARLANRRVLVTGGSVGIGAAIVRRLAAEGAAVAFTYRSREAPAHALVTEIAAAGGQAHALAWDAETDDARVLAAQASTALGGLEILVLNAAIAQRKPLPETSLAEFDRFVTVNLRAPYALALAAAERMSPGGRIIAIGSSFGGRVPVPGVGLYAMTKFGLAGLMRALARDLGKSGITVNVVQPGPIDTEMNPAASGSGRLLAMMTALGRHGTSENVAALVAFLAAPEAGYMTGAVLAVDGGLEA